MPIPPTNIYAADVGTSVLVYPVQPGSTLGRPSVGRIVRVSTAYAWVRSAPIRDHLRVARSTGRGSVYGEHYAVQIPTAEDLDRVRRAQALEELHGAVVQAERSFRSPSSPSKAIAAEVPTRDIEATTRALRVLLGLARSEDA